MWGHDSFLVEGDITGDDEERRVAVRYHRPSRALRIEENGEPASPVTFFAHYPFVLFLPEDTFLFSRGPAGRRNFLNHILVTHPHYVSAIVQYQRVLKQRNAMLKKANTAADVSSWTELLSEHARTLWWHREQFADIAAEQLSEVYSRLSGERCRFAVQLARGVLGKGEFIADLTESFSYERRVGYTIYGPHRDDLIVSTDGRLVGVALSRGQLRSLTIALKIIAHRYLKQVTGEEPILLLDDVLSELDEERQRALLENLPKTQTLLTCTTLPTVLREREDVYLLDVRSIVERVSDSQRKTKSLEVVAEQEELEQEQEVREREPV